MNKMRIGRMFYENEGRFIGMDMFQIDNLIDECWLFDEYNCTFKNHHFTMVVIDDDYVYEWEFDEDDICIACDTYEYEPEDVDAWEETLGEIEEREYYRTRM